MSISSSLSNAVSGMTAAARMAEIVSSNVSNSLTDGYGRRTLDLSSAHIGGRGAGVEIGGVVRHVDRGIIADRRLADASLAGFETLVSMMGRIEDAVGQAGDNNSISARIVAVEAALIDAAADPSSLIRLDLVADRLNALTNGLNDASQNIQTLRVEADASIANQVDQLNTGLRQVEQLNGDIMSARLNGIDPSSLMDERQRVVDQIAQIVPVRELDRDNGQIALMTPSGETLIDGSARQFGFDASPVITPDMTLASGGLSSLMRDGVAVGDNGFGRLGGGTLGAAFQARDVELIAAQGGLDAVAADLIGRFQDPTVDPTLGTTVSGLLTDGGAAFNATNTSGLAGRISVNAAIDPAQGGVLTALRDGLNATTPGPSGNASLLQSLSSALAQPRTTSGDATQQGAAGRASSFEARVGSQRLNFESELSFANARWSGLKEAEAATGVDTDFEMQMLLRIEQAYAANARVIQTVDTLMQRLLEI